MNKKELRYAITTVLAASENNCCSELHHPKKHQHKGDEPCKAEYHLQRQVNIVREYFKEHEVL